MFFELFIVLTLVAALVIIYMLSLRFCKGRCVEFFEGENSRLSMTRLLMFMSFFPSSYVVVVNGNEGMLGWYIGGYVLGYVGGKGADVFMSKRGDHTERTERSVTVKTEKKNSDKEEE